MTSGNPQSDYGSATDFLLGRINYERALTVPYQTQHFKLGRMRALLDRLGNPQQRVKAVHVAGTKGKGSTSVMIASILHAAGYRIGVFTSPHLQGVEERMAIDGAACSQRLLADLVESVRPAVEAMDRQTLESGAEHDAPTYFEVITAMAFLYFDREDVDLAVMEVGLGGRLDSTNVCHPIVSVITSISLDHTRQLGDTLSAIAKEKAGIIKPDVPVVSGVRPGQPRQVIEQTARRHGAPLAAIDVDFQYHYRPPAVPEKDSRPHLSPGGTISFRESSRETPLELDEVLLSLLGEHQAANAALALATVGQLRRQGWDVPEKAIRRGLSEARCPARIEFIPGRPPVIVDVAHNTAAVAALMRVLEESFPNRRRVLVLAATFEKDLRGMLAELLPGFAHTIITRYQGNPRSVPPEQLAELADELLGDRADATARRVEIVPLPRDAWDRACESAGDEDLICITGSFFIAAELRPTAIEHGAVSTDSDSDSDSDS